ncbi:MAG: hypothetical protein KBT27_11390 [Prevotellaceae bacterium]|nr:hypothetical protein [Candidatus Faecinaster equi]
MGRHKKIDDSQKENVGSKSQYEEAQSILKASAECVRASVRTIIPVGTGVVDTDYFVKDGEHPIVSPFFVNGKSLIEGRILSNYNGEVCVSNEKINADIVEFSFIVDDNRRLKVVVRNFEEYPVMIDAGTIIARIVL